MPIPDIENNESGLSVRETLNDVIAAVNALGTAANEPTTAFATAAQGSLADSAVQPGDLGTAAYQSTTAFATAAQGSLADSAVQPGDLGNSASLNVGTTAGTVCSGDDNRLSNARTPTAHASSHVTGGTDKIRDATASQDGLMTTAYASKLDGIEAGADVTDAANVGSSISGSTTETTLADTDEIAFVTSLGALKNIAYSSLKTLLNAIYALKGVITGSGLTMSTARLLGRTTASAGAVEEISIGSGLSLASGILSATGSGGAVVKIVSAIKTDTASVTGTTPATVFSASITPASASNRIAIVAMLSVGQATNNAAYIDILRGSTAILQGDTAGSRRRVTTTGYTNQAGQFQSAALVADDLPGVTTSTTYNIQLSSNTTGSVFLNRSATDTDSNIFARGASSILLIEYTP